MLAQNGGRLPISWLGLDMNFYTDCKGFQLSSTLIIVVPLTGLFLLHSLSQ